MAALTRYTPGTRAEDGRPGDFVLYEDRSWIGWGIRFGQRLRFRGKDRKYAWPNHTAVLISPHTVVEAVGEGVLRRPLEDYDSRDYVLIKVDASDEDRDQMVKFVLSCIGYPYGFVTDLSFALTLFLGFKIDFTVDRTYICSQLVGETLVRAGYILPRSAQRMSPADLAKMFDAVRNKL